MKVTERLQSASKATSFFAGLALAILPATALGQIVTTSQPYEPVESKQPVGVEARANSTLSQLDMILLEARRAIAQGNVEQAERYLTQSQTIQNSQANLGDSPDVIRTLINKQNELVKLYDSRAPSYNVEAANFLMLQASALLKYQDYKFVESLVAQAQQFPVEEAQLSVTPTSVLQSMASAKSNNAMSEQSNVAVSAVLRLMSQAQLAFDQGDLDTAQSLTDKAKAYGVADAQLPAQQVLPWQLELRIQEAMRSNGRVIAAGFDNSKNQSVIRADFDPRNDSSRNAQASATSSLDPNNSARIKNPEFSKLPGKGRQFFDAGMAALRSNDLSNARQNFEMAWQNRSQLDATTQQIVQDKLSSLPTNSTATDATLPNPSGQDLEGLPGVDSASSATQMLLSDNEDMDKLKRIQKDIFRQRTIAEKMREEDPRGAVDLLMQTRSNISQNVELNEQEKKWLFALVDRDIADFQKYIEQNFADIQLRERNEAALADVRESRQKKYNAEQQIKKLVEDFNDLIDEQRYAEAELVAKQVYDLAPESEIAVQLRENAKIGTNLDKMLRIQARKEDAFFERLADVDEDTINNVTEKAPLLFDDTDRWGRISRIREQSLLKRTYSSPEEAAIWNKLKNEKVEGHFQGTLNDAITQLSEYTGINILFDNAALAAEAVSSNNSIDVPIRQPISLESALKVILGSSGLIFVVEDEVIKVTSRDAQRRDVKPITYYVGDLVTPIQNFKHSLNMSFMSPNGPVGQNGLLGQTPAVPLANNNVSRVSPIDIASQTTGAPNALAQQLPGLGNPVLGGLGGGPVQTGTPQYSSIGPPALGGVTEQDFQPLINLIRNTIDPDGWDDTNGDGTINAFVPNLSLIVSQTQEVQDQIQDLLQQLRELNDVQIVVEVRFITLNDDFFERIGIDFDFQLNDNTGFSDANPFGDEVNPSAVVGLDPTGNFPNDRDIPFQQSFFTSSIPQFGGFNLDTAANFGFAILSDIEVFFLIQASKGDSRTNVTSAPTLTMFNGQVANVIEGAAVPFVTSVIPVVGDFAVAQQPVITILHEGTNLNVQAVVSNDRKSVRMTLVPYFSQVTNVEEFTFDGSMTTQRASDQTLIDDLLGVVTGGATDPPTEIETVTEGVTIQLPTLGQTSVSTVVSVPDGGTILLGGIKSQTEQRLERGVPFLSNIPYVSRLFKNVGISRETSSVMMMVSPRIIIQEEEELEQVGTQSRRLTN